MKVIKVQRARIFKINNCVFKINSCVLIIDSNLILFYKNKKLNNEYGFAKIYKNKVRDWFYKDEFFGSDDDFTVKTWKKKVKQLKREEKLKIFI